MIKNLILSLIMFIGLSSVASAQLVPSGSPPSPALTPGHTLRILSPLGKNGAVIGDGGGAGGTATQGQGTLTEIGITNTGTPFCIHNSLINSGTDNPICIGHDANNNPIFTVNGVSFPFAAGNGNVTGPATPTAGNAACYLDATGTRIKDCSVGASRVVLGNQSEDPRIAAFGPTQIANAVIGGVNGAIFWSVETTPLLFPVAISDGCRLDLTLGGGGSCSGGYDEAWLDTNGLVEGREIDTGSKAGTPQVVFPFTRGPLGSITQILPIGLTIAATNRTGYTNDSSAAIDIENNGQKFLSCAICVNPAAVGPNGYSIQGGARALFGDSTVTGVILQLKGGTGANDPQGAVIELTNTSTGVSAPNKFIRVNGINSNLEVINSALSAAILTLTDVGALGLASGIQPTAILAVNLPACISSASEGSIYPVKDSSSATFNATFTGGGSNHIIAYCNGTSWVVH